jgi:hypothetical protein
MDCILRVGTCLDQTPSDLMIAFSKNLMIKECFQQMCVIVLDVFVNYLGHLTSRHKVQGACLFDLLSDQFVYKVFVFIDIKSLDALSVDDIAFC